MQRLASQAQTREQEENNNKKKSSNNNNKRKSMIIQTGTAGRKTEASTSTKNDMGPPLPKKSKLVATVTRESIKINSSSNLKSEDKNDASFDVFSHAVGAELLAQKQAYEMRRVWDTWAEQTAWLRSLSEVEQSSGVSSSVILSHYKSNIYPRRQLLLECLRDSVQNDALAKAEEVTSSSSIASIPPTVAPTNMLSETPLASVLLPHVVAASELLSSSGKQGSRG